MFTPTDPDAVIDAGSYFFVSQGSFRDHHRARAGDQLASPRTINRKFRAYLRLRMDRYA